MNMIVTTSYISREPSNERAYESEHIYKCRSEKCIFLLCGIEFIDNGQRLNHGEISQK